MMIEKIKGNSDDWMTALLRSPIFQRLPPINLQKILMKLEDVHFEQGEVILDQGSEGDYYYLIKNGQCQLSRKPSPKAKEIKLAQLATGDTFGEDALITGATRDLTVIALRDTSLLRLNKELFLSLIKEPSIKFVDYTQMQEAMKKGAILLDVRTPDEYAGGHIEGSINEPFFLLRMQLKTLDREKPFIVVCGNGKVSEAAAFLLLNNKIEVTVLKGGMANITPEPENGNSLSSAGDSGLASENSDRESQIIGQSADRSGNDYMRAFKPVFFRYFENLVNDCCTRIDFEFGLQLGKDREKMSKEQYLKLLEYLRSVRNDIERNYLVKVNDIFDGSSQAVATNQAGQVDFSKVALISDDAAKENQAIARIIRQCEHLFHDELISLTKQFATRPEKRAVVDSQNPIFPEKLVRALAEVVKPLKLSEDNKIILYKTFDVNVFSQLGDIYRELLNSLELRT
jgi:rhodanese-related sulfurtransferase